MKRLDEILEECIAAGIEGRRTVEESLSLYPAEAEELEPLLRTALSVSDTFQSYNPPGAVQERGLSRFLADASARRRLRDLAGSLDDGGGWRGWFGGLWRKPVFGSFAAAAAVLVVAVALTAGAANLGGGSDDPEPFVQDPSPTVQPAPSVYFDLQTQLDTFKHKRDTGGQIETADLYELTAIVARFNRTPMEELQADPGELKSTLDDTLDILTSDPEAQDDPEVQEAIKTTRDVAALHDIELGDPVTGSPKTPTPTPPVVTTPASPTPTAPTTPAPTKSQTPAPTPSPTQQPTPSATADNREPPGFLP